MNHKQFAKEIWEYLYSEDAQKSPFLIIDKYLQNRPSFVKRRYYALSANVLELRYSKQQGTTSPNQYDLLEEYFHVLANTFSQDLINEQEKFDHSKTQEAIQTIDSWTIKIINNETLFGDIDSFFNQFYSSQKPLHDQSRYQYLDSLFQPSFSHTSTQKSQARNKYVSETLDLANKLRNERRSIQENTESKVFEKYPDLVEVTQLIAKNKLPIALKKACHLFKEKLKFLKKLHWMSYNYELLMKEKHLGLKTLPNSLKNRETIINHFVGFIFDDL